MEKLNELVNAIETAKSLQEEVENELKSLETAQLKEAVEIARKGLPYRRVEVSHEEHNCNTCNHEPRIEYFEYSSTPLKASKIVSHDHSERGDIKDGTELDFHELWITPEGKWFTTQRAGHESNWQNTWWGWGRSTPEFVETPPEEFSLENILIGLQGALEKHLKELGDKTKSQQARLEKIRALQSK